MSGLYFTHAKMRSFIKKTKKVHNDARIIGLDLGRKYIGVAISDKQIKTCVPYKTLLIDPQHFKQSYDFQKNSTFFNAFRNIIRNKHIKALIVGYPMTNKNEQTVQCQYVERFIEHMWEVQNIKIPITLVNEYDSSMQAKVRLAEMIQKPMKTPTQAKPDLVGYNEMISSSSSDLILQQNLHEIVSSGQIYSINTQSTNLNPEVMLRKGVYDKIAAQIILQQFLDFYNKDDETATSINQVKQQTN